MGPLSKNLKKRGSKPVDFWGEEWDGWGGWQHQDLARASKEARKRKGERGQVAFTPSMRVLRKRDTILLICITLACVWIIGGLKAGKLIKRVKNASLICVSCYWLILHKWYRIGAEIYASPWRTFVGGGVRLPIPFYKKTFWMWIILKFFLNLLRCCFCFSFWFSEELL